VFDFDMGEESRIAEVRLATGTYIVSVVGLVAASPSPSALLEGVLQTCREHHLLKISSLPPNNS
jgi:hypothetical protein